MISTYDWFIARCKAVINHSRPPEPPMRVRLHEAGHAVAGRRFGYVQQGIMLHEDDTGETSQQYATGMDDDMSVRLQTEINALLQIFINMDLWELCLTGSTRACRRITIRSL